MSYWADGSGASILPRKGPATHMLTRRLMLIICSVMMLGLLVVPNASADFSITAFDGFLAEGDGSASTQAGGHPYSYSTEFELSSSIDPSSGAIVADANPRDFEVRIPPGLIGDPTAAPTCTAAQMGDPGGGAPFNKCPIESQIGVAEIDFTLGGSEPTSARMPIYNVVPFPGEPATFAFTLLGYTTFLHPKVRTGEDYGVSVEISPASQATQFIGGKTIFWGVPGDPSHDAERGVFCLPAGNCAGSGAKSEAPVKAFLTNPSNCSAGPLPTRLRVDSWQEIGNYKEVSYLTHLSDGTPAGFTGCSRVPFDPSIRVETQSSRADSPTGLKLSLEIPQNSNPSDYAEAYLKRAIVTLPRGVTINPSAGTGLAGCARAQADLDSPHALGCPDASKIGSVEVETPLLGHPVKGAVYAAAQGDNPFGSLLAIYIGIDDPLSGVVVKLAGKVEADPVTGQLTTVVDESPQLPFSRFDLNFFSGPRSPLRTPSQCGTYTTTGTFSSWSAADPNNPTPAETVTSVSDFTIDSGPNGGPCPSGGFAPDLSAGTVSPVAGNYSPALIRVTRQDGSPELQTLDVKLPRGLIGKFAGIPYCPEAAIAAATARGGEGQGALELASPSCPAASQIGTVVVGAGSGPNPFYIDTGKAYLAGPYKGAPLSVVVITPAIAGPFDLGAVVVRSAIQVDPTTADATAVTDPLPTILHGIPLALRDVRLNLNRDQFVLNPTSCAEKAFSGTATALTGATAPLSERFQVGSCERLGFKPKLALRLKGGTKRSQYPALTAVLQAKKGDANISRTSVALPHSEFLAQEHINTICTRVQFAADNCPKGSVYGSAIAFSPLLDKPLKGPVYLRSSNHPLPDMVVALDGQFDIDLVGRIDSVNGGIRTNFDSIPDAPVTKFVLKMKGGAKSLLVNSRDICRTTNRATVKMKAQNGKSHNFAPALRPKCGKAKKK